MTKKELIGLLIALILAVALWVGCLIEFIKSIKGEEDEVIHRDIQKDRRKRTGRR